MPGKLYVVTDRGFERAYSPRKVWPRADSCHEMAPYIPLIGSAYDISTVFQFVIKTKHYKNNMYDVSVLCQD